MFTESATVFKIVEFNGIPKPVFLALIAKDIFIVEAVFAYVFHLINDGEVTVFLAAHGASAFVVFTGSWHFRYSFLFIVF
jgi:hypothetical protein